MLIYVEELHLRKKNDGKNKQNMLFIHTNVSFVVFYLFYADGVVLYGHRGKQS